MNLLTNQPVVSIPFVHRVDQIAGERKLDGDHDERVNEFRYVLYSHAKRDKRL